jgi:hypothetical protein
MSGKMFTKQQLISYLVNFSIKNNVINISKNSIDNDKSYPSSTTFKRYFGSWKNALKNAGLGTGIITGRPSDPKINITDRALEVIIGELLGDGCLVLTGSHKSNACFSHSTANIYYGQYLYNKLIRDNVPLLKKEYLPPRNNGKPQFRTRTVTNQYWTSLYHKWYKSNTKIVPYDIKLTKEVCLHWFLGDGYFEQGTIKISTCGFNKEEVLMLSNLLSKEGFKSNINKRSGGFYIIRFSRCSYRDFLYWIGDCPVIGYEHRWGLYG